MENGYFPNSLAPYVNRFRKFKSCTVKKVNVALNKNREKNKTLPQTIISISVIIFL